MKIAITGGRVIDPASKHDGVADLHHRQPADRDRQGPEGFQARPHGRRQGAASSRRAWSICARGCVNPALKAHSRSR
jgi:hypothetical protein